MVGCKPRLYSRLTTMIGFNGNSLVTINAIEVDIQTMRVVDFTGCFDFLLEVWKFLWILLNMIINRHFQLGLAIACRPIVDSLNIGLMAWKTRDKRQDLRAGGGWWRVISGPFYQNYLIRIKQNIWGIYNQNISALLFGHQSLYCASTCDIYQAYFIYHRFYFLHMFWKK